MVLNECKTNEINHERREKMNIPSYYCFSTPKNSYMYVRNINSVIRITEDEHYELIKAKKNNDAKCDVVEKYKRLGIFIDNPVKIIEHPATDTLEYQANYMCQHLMLQVTQQCNLRCEYCAYSGMYDNRVHSSKRMDFTLAKKAIDFFIEHGRESKRLTLGFYGGEPLLEFPLIKQCMDYMAKQIEGKEIHYAITTNGTLLNDEIGDYFAKHNVSLAISLDGSKKEHDLHRRFRNGAGSFDVIMNNIKRLKERHPDYGRDIVFVPVITPNASLSHVIQYFTTDELLKEHIKFYNPISENGKKKDLEQKESYDELDFQMVQDFEYFKLLLFLAGKIDREDTNQFVARLEESHLLFYQRLSRHDMLGEATHHGGPCIPGVARLFVNTDGKFYPCEKVSETNPESCIGNVEQGFDLAQMEKVLNVGRITKEECKECWNLGNCTICVANLEYDKECFSKKAKYQACEEQKRGVSNYIYETAVLSEFGYTQEGRGLIVYG